MAGQRWSRLIRRSGALVLLLAMVVPVVAVAAAAPADAATAPVRAFQDTRGSTFADDTVWIAERGITLGCDPSGTRFCPDTSVTRGQMAAFLVRALDLTARSGLRFADVPTSSVFVTDIDALATEGITRGCASGGFCPAAPVTRAQMAAFLVRALELRGGSGITFRDVPADSVFAADIDALAAAGVTLGCSKGAFCPAAPVTRGQMAAFLRRALDGRSPVVPPAVSTPPASKPDPSVSEPTPVKPVAPEPEPTPVAPEPEPTPVAPEPEPTPVAPEPEPTPVAPEPAPPAGVAPRIEIGDTWRWRYEDTAPPADWFAVDFSDAGWAAGASPLGFGAGDLRTDMGRTDTAGERPLSAQFRHTFTVADPTTVPQLELTVPADDGVHVRVNGVEVARVNLGKGTVHSGTYATAAPRSEAARDAATTYEVPRSSLRAGRNVVAVSTHLNWRRSPDMRFELSLAPAAGDTPPAAAPQPPVTSDGYRVYWSDEFDGSSVDPAWRRYHNTYGDGNKELQCYTPDNVKVGGGTVRIEARRESVRCPVGTNLDRDYTSGFLGTRDTGNYFPRYARYEIRAKLPHAQGLWPAFWLRHRNGASTAEVDIMEYFHSQDPGRYTATLHLDGRFNLSKKALFFETPTANPGWNTYAVDIEPDPAGVRFTFRLNGAAIHSYVDTQHRWTSAPADGTWDMALNLAIGGNWTGHPDGTLGYLDLLGRCSLWGPQAGSAPDNCSTTGIRRAQFPEALEVDYVRVYTKP